MNQLNQTILEGNIVRSAEKETEKGSFLLSLTVAANREYRNAAGEKTAEVSFFDCEAWGDFGKNIAAKCTKGRGVRIVGRLKQSRWKDGDGKNRSKVFVVVEHIDFMPFAEKAEEKL